MKKLLSPAVKLEPSSDQDAESLAGLRVLAMRESLERIGRFDHQRARDRFLSAFSPAQTRHILLEGKRVGFVVVHEKEQYLLLDHLYVQPESQSMGVGSVVLSMIFAKADDSGKTIRVGALRESASNRFYESHGFKLVEQSEWDNYYVRDSNRLKAQPEF